jgi:hypothetical protein
MYVLLLWKLTSLTNSFESVIRLVNRHISENIGSTSFAIAFACFIEECTFGLSYSVILRAINL